MDLVNRIQQRGPQIDRFRPDRLVPTASIRMEWEAGAWSVGDPLVRLAGICRACLVGLRADPLLGGQLDGRLRLPRRGAGSLRVGVDGGRRWVAVDEPTSDHASLLQRLGQPDTPRSIMRMRDRWLRRAGCLEVLDLSGLGISDWRGVVAAPLVARLVLLAQDWRPQSESTEWLAVFPVVLDFDHRLLDAGRAARFLQTIQADLSEGAQR